MNCLTPCFWANNMAKAPKQEIAVATEQLPQSPVQSMLNAIGKLAENPNINADVIQKAFDMQMLLLNKQAEIAFNNDMLEVKRSLPKIQKKGKISYEDKKSGKEVSTAYALFEDIEDVVAPIYTKFGFKVAYNYITTVDGKSITEIIVSHSGGHTEKYQSIPLMLDTTGSKNNVQAAGSTMSYGRRYALVSAFNIVISGMDNDGVGDKSPISSGQLQELNDLVDEYVNLSGIDKVKQITSITNYFKADSLACIPENRFGEAVKIMQKKIDSMKGAGNGNIS